jgi:arginine-tRNA-protein transferase
MSNHFIQPTADGFKDACLDEYLALGYYRMRNSIFTTNQVFVEYYGNSALFTPVFWLRTVLDLVAESRSSLRIRKKCSGFTVRFLPAVITEEMEELYTAYRNHINFDTSDSCRECMTDEDININPFNSRMIEVRDGARLIAVGYFDIGLDSSMAILHFYHPDYRQFSLGKYLMLQSLDYSREQQMRFYYPGYLSTTHPKMDYKIFPDLNAIEVFFPVEKEWLPYRDYSKLQLHDYFMSKIAGFGW